MSYNSQHKDLPYVYELFLRRVYHCGRGEDPFGLANADMFSFNDEGRLDQDTSAGIWIAFIILRNQIKDQKSRNDLKRISDLFESDPTMKCFDRLCPEIFKILENNEIYEFPHWKVLPYEV